MSEVSPPQVIHDAMAKTAMVVFDNRTYVIKGKFGTTAAAESAARLQYPSFFNSKPREPI